MIDLVTGKKGQLLVNKPYVSVFIHHKRQPPKLKDDGRAEILKIVNHNEIMLVQNWPI